jgi:hypothetical protein
MIGIGARQASNVADIVPRTTTMKRRAETSPAPSAMPKRLSISSVAVPRFRVG